MDDDAEEEDSSRVGLGRLRDWSDVVDSGMLCRCVSVRSVVDSGGERIPN